MENSEKRKVKVEAIGQIGIVVKDCEKASRQWERILGIGPWSIHTNTRTDAEGNPVEIKIGIAYIGELEIELIEVAKGKTILSEWLEEHGEGVHHLSFFVDDPDGDAANLVDLGAKLLLQKPGQLSYLDCGPGGVTWEPQRKRGKITPEFMEKHDKATDEERLKILKEAGFRD